MLAFLTQRLLQVIPTLILVSMLIFGLQQLLGQIRTVAPVLVLVQLQLEQEAE
mgnify:CR=1 FL=1